MKNNSPFLDNRFSEKYYDHVLSGKVSDATYCGVAIVKCPMDLHAYQEIIHETRPDLIIETGAFLGGSTLYLAHRLDLLGGEGRVVSVELDTTRELPVHPRITYLRGRSSTEPDVMRELHALALERRAIMVVLDSAHNRSHVLRELQMYSPLVSKGCYLIVEDTNVHGYKFAPGDIQADGGPAEAVKEWQPVNRGFECDRAPERFLMTFQPGGYLRRIRK